MDYQQYIKAELLVLIPVLYFIGMVLKKSKISNNRIPIILGIISIVLSTIWVISTNPIKNLQECLAMLFTSVTQGVLLAGTCVYANQIYVQSKKKE